MESEQTIYGKSTHKIKEENLRTKWVVLTRQFLWTLFREIHG